MKIGRRSVSKRTSLEEREAAVTRERREEALAVAAVEVEVAVAVAVDVVLRGVEGSHTSAVAEEVAVERRVALVPLTVTPLPGRCSNDCDCELLLSFESKSPPSSAQAPPILCCVCPNPWLDVCCPWRRVAAGRTFIVVDARPGM